MKTTNRGLGNQMHIRSSMSPFLRDKGGRRLGVERRQFSYDHHTPERRSGQDRRSGKDRRSGEVTKTKMAEDKRKGKDRRNSLERRAAFSAALTT